jgi:Alpha/beta hydrolase family
VSRRRRWLVGGCIAIAVLVVVATGGFLAYARPQPLLPEATAALADTPDVRFQAGADGRLTYTPSAGAPSVGLVLYPGGKVPPAAYAPAARAIAAAGYLVVIVDVPFQLAILGVDAPTTVIADHPEIATWALGGHSLGGAAAALFIDGHPGVADGLVLWASYSSVDLADAGLRVSTSYGSLDAGVSTFTDPANLARLGPAVVTTVIEGGNHEGMGWYTGQPNDPPATIARTEQQDAIVAATVNLLAALEEPPPE